jgi:transcriptional regulator GlxA family with amidase domain
MMENVQLADVMGMDILGNLSMRHYEEGITFDSSLTRWADHPVHMTFYYIGTTLDPTGASPDIKYLPNITYDDCPRDLDILIIGGPPPTHRPPQADRFMKEAWPKTRVWLVTCIGSMWLASTGLLNGKKSTTNRGLISVAKRMYPEVDWVDQKWVVTEKDYDVAGGKGEIWTAGGAAAG